MATSTNGFERKVTVRDTGKFVIRALPVGFYRVTLKKDGKAVDTYRRVPLTFGRSAEVNFACPHDKCSADGASS